MRSFEEMDVAITYGWNRVAYNVLRSLSARGLNVAVGDAASMAMAKRSKFCRHAFSYPSFYLDPRGFVESLKSTFSALRPAVYIPMHEEIFVVARYIDEFEQTGVKIPIHDFKSLKTAHKKDALANLAEELDIPVPRTFKPADVSDLKGIWRELGARGRVVIKLPNTNSAKGVFYASSFEELLKTHESVVEKGRLEPAGYPIIQEYVEGAGYGVSLLFNRGQLRARFTHRRLREKIATGGTSTKRISVRNPLLEEYAERLLSSMNWHGVAMVEFKYDEESKKAWLIEVNPRFWGSLALPVMAGVDFPYLLYRMAVDGDVEPVLKYREGVVARWLLGDILATMSSIKQRRSLRPLADFFAFRGEKYDDFNWDDLFPFFAECAYYFSKLVRTAKLNPVDEALLDVDKL